MLIKEGVAAPRLWPPLTKRLECVDKIYESMGEQMTITTTCVGTRRKGTPRPADLVIGFACPVKMDGVFMAVLRDCFNDDYSVYEEEGHIYVEFNPK